jgi:hypothetical protein
MTNRNELLGTEELELVSGGWFACAMGAGPAKSVLNQMKDAGSQYKELPAGRGNGMTVPPVDHKPMFWSDFALYQTRRRETGGEVVILLETNGHGAGAHQRLRRDRSIAPVHPRARDRNLRAIFISRLFARADMNMKGGLCDPSHCEPRHCPCMVPSYQRRTAPQQGERDNDQPQPRNLD